MATKQSAPRRRFKALRHVATLGSTALQHDGGVRAVAVASDGAFLASVGDSKSIHLWDAGTGERLCAIEGTDRDLDSMSLSPDGKLAFAGGRKVQCFDLAKRKVVATFAAKPRVRAIACEAGVLLYGDDRRPRRFDLSTRKELASLKGHQNRVVACALSRDASRAITSAGDRNMKVHALDGKTPEVIATLHGFASACGFFPDGARGWSVGWDHVRTFSVRDGKVLWSLRGATASSFSGALSPDGSRLAVAYENEVLVFELPSKKAMTRG